MGAVVPINGNVPTIPGNPMTDDRWAVLAFRAIAGTLNRDEGYEMALEIDRLNTVVVVQRTVIEAVGLSNGCVPPGLLDRCREMAS